MWLWLLAGSAALAAGEQSYTGLLTAAAKRANKIKILTVVRTGSKFCHGPRTTGHAVGRDPGNRSVQHRLGAKPSAAAQSQSPPCDPETEVSDSCDRAVRALLVIPLSALDGLRCDVLTPFLLK